TKLSSKGQVVIPENIREAMGLEPGIQFIVVYEGDSIILKVISQPTLKRLKSLREKVRIQAKRAGLSPEDIKSAIRDARNQ
ncbi:MAG: AbrB/MazE/SpoVT family DNA-binding domain-containing protein, partial [Proteobacteria bacterium]|nr:AbrB/MazE/SpoVT family DNA-binding domain-containing protein [Pseudomonadota bacterium]